MQVIEYDLLQLLVHLLLLTQNDVALALDSRSIELGVLQDVADDVDSLRDVLPEALRVVHSLFPGRVGVQVSADILNFKLQGVLCATSGTLEGHVLQEMRRSAGRVGFGP